MSKELNEIKTQVNDAIEEKKSWLRERWWLGWAILGFFVACGVLWRVTR